MKNKKEQDRLTRKYSIKKKGINVALEEVKQ